MSVTIFLCCMITIGTSFFEKLSVLLVMMLCCTLTLSMPVVSYAAEPSGSAVPTDRIAAEDALPFTVTAGEVSAGDTKAVLQLEKYLLAQPVHSLFRQIYPAYASSPAVPAFYAFSKRDCGLNSILTKGP